MGFRQKLARFFYGRNGVDALYYFNFAVFLTVAIVRVFTRSIVVAIVLYIVEALLIFILVFRMLSRNLAKRRRENAVFLRIFKATGDFFKLTFNRIRYIKKYRYRTCKSCRAVLRLPVRRGTNTVTCPRCRKKMQVKVLF